MWIGLKPAKVMLKIGLISEVAKRRVENKVELVNVEIMATSSGYNNRLLYIPREEKWNVKLRRWRTMGKGRMEEEKIMKKGKLKRRKGKEVH